MARGQKPGQFTKSKWTSPQTGLSIGLQHGVLAIPLPVRSTAPDLSIFASSPCSPAKAFNCSSKAFSLRLASVWGEETSSVWELRSVVFFLSETRLDSNHVGSYYHIFCAFLLRRKQFRTLGSAVLLIKCIQLGYVGLLFFIILWLATESHHEMLWGSASVKCSTKALQDSMLLFSGCSSSWGKVRMTAMRPW